MPRPCDFGMRHGDDFWPGDKPMARVPELLRGDTLNFSVTLMLS